MESAAKIMGLRIRPGEPDDLTIAQLIRQRADLLAALEKIAIGCALASITIKSGGNVGKQNQNMVSLASACGEIALEAIQSVKGNAPTTDKSLLLPMRE